MICSSCIRSTHTYSICRVYVILCLLVGHRNTKGTCYPQSCVSVLCSISSPLVAVLWTAGDSSCRLSARSLFQAVLFFSRGYSG